MKDSQLWRFLVLMTLHPSKHSVEHPDSIQDVRTFVEHYAFGAVCHGCVRDLRARWQALL